MKVQIERNKDINAAMFDLLSIIQADAVDLNDAQTIFNARFGPEHSLYWLYRGGQHLAIHSHHHTRRIAIITK